MATYYLGGPQAKSILHRNDSAIAMLVKNGRLKDYGVTTDGAKKHMYKFLPEDVHALAAALALEDKERAERKLAEETNKVQKLRVKVEQAALPMADACGESLAALHAKVDALTAAVAAMREMWS
jgi:hypothetical protein